MFEKLQVEQIVRIRLEVVSLDSTSIKVHPDGTGALNDHRLKVVGCSSSRLKRARLKPA